MTYQIRQLESAVNMLIDGYVRKTSSVGYEDGVAVQEVIQTLGRVAEEWNENLSERIEGGFGALVFHDARPSEYEAALEEILENLEAASGTEYVDDLLRRYLEVSAERKAERDRNVSFSGISGAS